MIIQIVVALLNLLAIAIIIRALLSWIDPMGRNQITQALDVVTEPVLRPVRNLIGAVGGFDLSPIIVLVLIQVLSAALTSSFR